MKKILANVWTKRVVAIVSVIYTYFVCKLCYYSIFYDIHVQQRTSLCLSITGVSLAALIIMLYTRHQILTRISSFIILPAMLPVVLLYFGEWGLIIPIIVVGIVILLLSGAGEGVGVDSLPQRVRAPAAPSAGRTGPCRSRALFSCP